jgi:hypothetical protein
VNGVDIYDDYSGMMQSCSDDVANYVGCGAYLGDMVCAIWRFLYSLALGLQTCSSCLRA